MEIDELVERLDAIKVILEEIDNAATPELVEAIVMVKNIITEKQLKLDQERLNDKMVKFNATFDNVFDQFIMQLMREVNKKDDKKFGK